jgi:hypothetical protein
VGSNTTWNIYANGPSPDPDNQITPVPEPSFYGAIAVALALVLAAGASLRRSWPRAGLPPGCRQTRTSRS